MHWNMTTRRILVMDYIEGGNINDLEYMQKNKISTRDVCDKVGKLYSKMIFDHGFVHCDPHPGNIIVRKRAKGDAEICLLDHGLYTVIVLLNVSNKSCNTMLLGTAYKNYVIYFTAIRSSNPIFVLSALAKYN